MWAYVFVVVLMCLEVGLGFQNLTCPDSMEKVFDTWSLTYRCECPLAENVSLLGDVSHAFAGGNVFENPVRERVVKCSHRSKLHMELVNVEDLFKPNDRTYNFTPTTVVQLVFPKIVG